MSRLESGKIVQLEQMDIKPAIEQTLRNYRLNASEKNVSLAHDIAETIPPFLGNFDLLLQVFDNLLGNGLKFSPKNSTLIKELILGQIPVLLFLQVLKVMPPLNVNWFHHFQK